MSAGAMTAPPDAARDALQRVLVQPRIGHLRIDAADQHRAVGAAERRLAPARVGGDAIDAGLATRGSPRGSGPAATAPRSARTASTCPSGDVTRTSTARVALRHEGGVARVDRRSAARRPAPAPPAASIATGSGAACASQRAACRQNRS